MRGKGGARCSCGRRRAWNAYRVPCRDCGRAEMEATHLCAGGELVKRDEYRIPGTGELVEVWRTAEPGELVDASRLAAEKS